MKRTVLFLGLAFALTAPAAFAQAAPPLEHFQCYTVLRADPPFVVKVGLKDQFTNEDVEVARARRFCNPAGKFHRNQFNPVEDVRQHLTFYATFPQDGPVRFVALSNQFNPVGAPQQLWRVREAVSLAVPTHKPPHDRPVGIDHYRCYAASGNQTFEVVGLIDQFLPFGGRFVLDPVLFCNPVEKTDPAGVVTPILHPDQHMACYSMTRVPFQTSRDIINQFGPQVVALGPPDTLCVPTRKIAFVTIPDAPIGGPGGQ
jgi:hypothetical protein